MELTSFLILLGLTMANAMENSFDGEQNLGIINGTEVPQNHMYPFMAFLTMEMSKLKLNTPVCGGSLIDARWVLTGKIIFVFLFLLQLLNNFAFL